MSNKLVYIDIFMLLVLYFFCFFPIFCTYFTYYSIRTKVNIYRPTIYNCFRKFSKLKEKMSRKIMLAADVTGTLLPADRCRRGRNVHQTSYQISASNNCHTVLKIDKRFHSKYNNIAQRQGCKMKVGLMLLHLEIYMYFMQVDLILASWLRLPPHPET